MYSPPGHLTWRFLEMTFRSAQLCRCLWHQFWPWPRFLFYVMFGSAETRHDHHQHDNRRTGHQPEERHQIWQYYSRPAKDVVLVVFLLDLVCDLLSDPTGLHVYHLTEI